MIYCSLSNEFGHAAAAMFLCEIVCFISLYNKNPCAWRSVSKKPRSVGTLQPTRPLGRVSSKFIWPSKDQCQRSHSKWVFVFIPHLKSKSSQNCLERRRSVFDDRHDGSLFWCALSCPRDCTLCDWSRAWPNLTWLAKLVGVSVSSSVRNTNFHHTLKP